LSFTLSDARALAGLAREAGQIILRIRDEHRSNKQDWGEGAKEDGSPVTRADRESEAHILSGIAKLGLSAPVVAEETSSAASMVGERRFYLIDPLDGTRSFVNGNDDFCVNIGFVEEGRPKLGVLYAPAVGESYFTDGATAWFKPANGNEEQIAARKPDAEALDVIVNRTEDWSGKLKNYLSTLQVRELHRESGARKLGLLARGKFDLYPRFGRSYEWDTAAGDAILRVAGGVIQTMEGVDLAYGKPGFVNPPFVARGKAGI
jgi:3'(2'), 5'-bisphosphate nucleotidase